MSWLKTLIAPLAATILAPATGAEAQTLFACAAIEECKMSEPCLPVDMTFAFEEGRGGREATLVLDGASYVLQRAIFRDDASAYVGTGPQDSPVLVTLHADGKLAMTLHEIMFFGAVVASTVSADCRKGG